MELVKIGITNFRGINKTKYIKTDLLNVIVGRNDAGKSTILKALDLFLNDAKCEREFCNLQSKSDTIIIELFFKPNNQSIIIDDAVETTFEVEELVNSNGLLQLKKEWDTSKTRITSDLSFFRKKYVENDFISKTETQLITLCGQLDIETNVAAAGEQFSNVEKRAKLRAHHHGQNVLFEYDYEKVPTTGTTRFKLIGTQIKSLLPRFEYFKADTSLSETDTAIQNYFKEVVKESIADIPETDRIEKIVQESLGAVLSKITEKINQVVPTDEHIQPSIDFDWTKLVKTSFSSGNDGVEVPLSSRGDGFRRITMMAYFEYLAESSSTDSSNIIFGFEEPETFLHPAAQEQLYSKFIDLACNGYELFVTTHSPIIVALTDGEDLIHIRRDEANQYEVIQRGETDLKSIADDLGVTVENQFHQLFNSAKAIIFVEGADDILALNHIANVYKENGVIPATLSELGIITIPTGGCGSIKHWVTFDLIKNLGKGFVIFQDSDILETGSESKNKKTLEALDFAENVDFIITKKRELENYIPSSYFDRTLPEANLDYGDFDDLKQICNQSVYREQLGGKEVLKENFEQLTFEELKSTFEVDGHDEFIVLYELAKTKIQN